MREEVISIKNQALGRIIDSDSDKELEEIRAEYLGKNGRLNQITKKFAGLSNEEKSTLGQLLNETKTTIQDQLQQAQTTIDSKKNKDNNFDPSIPGFEVKIGHLHPTTIVIREMTEIFKRLGFSIAEGPEVETDTYNFERLNLPKDHPARSLQDALYIEQPDVVLRTHTSSVEAQSLQSLKPPFRVVVAGKCYRYENVNASNNAMFYQFQGFALQKGISMADLKGTLLYFVKEYFGPNREIRFRCKYYPEVEPGVGLDLDCQFCNKKGCSVCKGRGWIEMLGAGMIHYNMLRQNGHDPRKISGYAFGMGLDRIVMDRYRINDIRSLYNGDIKY